MLEPRGNTMEKSRRPMHPNTKAALEESRPRRRGIKNDYKFYDGPETILRYITTGKRWEYHFKHPETKWLYLSRDRAAMALEYLAALRASEMVRGDTVMGEKGSILSTQFNFDDPDWLRLRDVVIVKHVPRKLAEAKGLNVSDMPKRIELKFPRRGGLAPFTKLIEEYLSMVKRTHPRKFANGMELFGIRRGRLYTLVNLATGKGPHYLRAQGLKLMSYLMLNNIANLKQFSGHTQTDSLLMYLSDVEYEKAMLSYQSPKVSQ